MLGLLSWWFIAADRYAVFLYGHLGAGPFDSITVGRYLMAPAVAGGALLLCYAAVNWAGGRIVSGYEPPGWLTPWLVAMPSIVVGVPVVTGVLGGPPLPAWLAFQCAGTTLACTALALAAGRLAARDPVALVWLALRGVALTPVLVLFKSLELPSRLSSVSPFFAVAVSMSSLAGSLVVLVALGVLRPDRGRPLTLALKTFVAGLAVAYLLLPLAHHLFATPTEYRYITASANFLASQPLLQSAILGLAAAIAWIAACLASTIRAAGRL